MDRGRLLHDLAHRFETEIHEDDIHHRAATRHGGADADACLCDLGDGGVTQTLSTKLCKQAPRLLPVAPANADALADVKDRRIAPHLFAQSFYSRIRVADDASGGSGPSL